MMTKASNVSKLNTIAVDELNDAFFRCSGSSVWTKAMVDAKPFSDHQDLFARSNLSWQTLSREDWLEAFKIHPRIGDIESLRKKFASTASWASDEQSGASHAPEEVLHELSKGNDHYEQKFGYIFIVCATGKSATEMLTLLKDRLHNDPEAEFAIACEEQKKITNLRLDKLLQ
jgi:2-oxo-4-hydroxy-4-carboxy-5-ureidoimidazoline decarboxylase